jgi:hypothetical protein
MADLGTKLAALAPELCSYKVPMASGPSFAKVMAPWLARSTRVGYLQPVPTPGTFSGSVKEAGNPVPNAVVRVYERASGFFVAETRTNAAGLFAFPNQRQASIDYYVIALDPEGGALYNGLIYDRVAPV